MHSIAIMYINWILFVYRFQPCDSFVGYQADTPSAVVFTASKGIGISTDQTELIPEMLEQEVC